MKSMCAILVLAAMTGLSVTITSAQDFKQPTSNLAVVIAPYFGELGDDSQGFVTALRAQGYTVAIYSQASPSYYPTVTVATFNNAFNYASNGGSGCGAGFITTHGFAASGDQEGSIALDAYPGGEVGGPGYLAANNAATFYLANGYRDGEVVIGGIGNAPSNASSWNVSLTASGISSHTVNRNTVVYLTSCNGADVAAAFHANAVVAYTGIVYTYNTKNQAKTFFGAMNGASGWSYRSAGNAYQLIEDGQTRFEYQYSATTLSPVIADLPINNGDWINGDLTTWIDFDSEMNRWDFNIVVTGAPGDNGRASIYDAYWQRGTRYVYTIHPYKPGRVTVRIHGAHSNDGPALDGNTNPKNSFGVGPNGDDHTFYFYTSATSDNYAASFARADASRVGGQTIVRWVTDPEIGSRQFQVYGGEHRERLLASVPAGGSPSKPHAYTVAVGGNESYIEVVEVDGTGLHNSTLPFPVSMTEPADAQQLDALNTTVAGWSEIPSARILPIYEDDDGGGNAVLTDLVFMSNRSDFLAATDTLRTWYQDHPDWHLSSQNILLSLTPTISEIQAKIKPIADLALARGKKYKVAVIEIGDWSEDDPSRQFIPMTSWPDTSGGECYWSTCASTTYKYDFLGTGTPMVDVHRILVSNLTELRNAIKTTFLTNTGQDQPLPRAFIQDGNRGDYCGAVTTEPTATLNLVDSIYRANGIPTVVRHESDYPCSDIVGPQTDQVNIIKSGTTELFGAGTTTTRSMLASRAINKVYTPVFSMNMVKGHGSFVGWFPTCGNGDSDRPIPAQFFPQIHRGFLTANPDTFITAAAWMSMTRGGLETPHILLNRITAVKRFDTGPNAPWCVQNAYYQAVDSLRSTQPGMTEHLWGAIAYGFPVRLNGMRTVAVADDHRMAPAKLMASPNPFGRQAHIQYSIYRQSRVRVGVYNVAGQLVRQLYDTPFQPAGSYRLDWDGRTADGTFAASGTYFLRLDLGTESIKRTLTLIR